MWRETSTPASGATTSDTVRVEKSFKQANHDQLSPSKSRQLSKFEIKTLYCGGKGTVTYVGANGAPVEKYEGDWVIRILDTNSCDWSNSILVRF